MSSPLDMVAMQTGVSEQSGRDLQNQLGNVGNLRGKNISPEAHAKKLREACEGFESIFIQKMWQEMRNAVPKGGLLQGREEKFWQDMYDHELSKSMTRAGGIGLADMMYAQLSRNLGNASRNTASSVTGAAFTPAAAPLVPEFNQESPLPDNSAKPETQSNTQLAQAPQATPSIYDGEAPQIAESADPQNGRPTAEAPVQAGQINQANQAHPAATASSVAQSVAGQAQAAAQANQMQRPDEIQKPQKSQKRGNRPARHRDDGDNPIDLVQVARRDAGDKLGAGAIRPALRPHKSSRKQAEQAELAQAVQQAAQPVIVDNRPGTAADLQRAMAAARGAQQAPSQSQTPLADIVARVKASQINPASGAQSMAAAEQANPAAGEAPTVRKVTYTTNMQKGGSRAAKRGQKDAIRMLNVDNTNPHSKAGKGIAAYHAQQAQVQAADQARQPAPVQQPVTPAAAPAPLTVQNAANDHEAGSGFAIPPLTAGDLRG